LKDRKRSVHPCWPISWKVVQLSEVLAGRRAAAELQKTTASADRLTGFAPEHAAYVIAQNQMSIMSEQLTMLDALAPIAKVIGRAEEAYMPGGPPMSPLTTSYFTCWAFFDACHGRQHETVGDIAIAVGSELRAPQELLTLYRLMQGSRMGVFEHRGVEAGRVLLRELVSGTEHRAIVPSGYAGRAGELWYVRVLPPPAPGSAAVVFTTPYVLVRPQLADWEKYFERVFGTVGGSERDQSLVAHMKFGPTRDYWNDFVFEGYVDHRTDAIFLAGLPDIAESRPHSEVNRR
jgi:hypothetical protein